MNITHGGSKTQLYGVWKGMRRRCSNPRATNFRYYGGRGIGVCAEWSASWPAFRDWSLANGYALGLTLDRIDTDGPYSPGNCRWTTWSVQQRNRRVSVLSKTRVKGVRLRKDGRYEARIRVGGERVNLGCFRSLEAARLAYRDSVASLEGVA